MAITQDQAALAKNIVSTFTPEQQTEFKSRYKGLKDQKAKESAINNLLSKYSDRVKEPDPVEEKVAGLYDKQTLATKMIPQFTKGLYESSLPFAKQAVMGDIPNQVMAGTPDPQGILPTIARTAGRYAPEVAMGIGAGGLAEQAMAKFVPMASGAGLVPRMARTAVGSATGVQFSQYDDLAQRAMMTGGAAIAGPVIGEAIGLGIKGGKFLMKEPAELFKAFRLAGKTRQIEEAVPQLNQEIQKATATGSNAVKDLKLSLGNKNKELGIQLSEAARTGSRDIQEKLGENLRKVSPEYGKRLNEIISKAKGSISVDDAANIAQDTLNEMKSRNISNPDVEQILTDYIAELRSVKTSPLVDEFGKVIQTANRPATDSISIGELSSKRTSVMSKLSPSGKSSGNYSQPDLAAIIFDKNLTERLSPIVGELKGLRGDYRQFKKLATEAYKIVRPKSGEYNTKAIEGLIKRVAQGKASAGEIELANAIEKGTSLLPGSGKFYADAEVVGKELQRVKNYGPTLIRQLEQKNQAIVDALRSKKVLAEADKRELARAWTRLKVYGSLLGLGGSVGVYKALT